MKYHQSLGQISHVSLLLLAVPQNLKDSDAPTGKIDFMPIWRVKPCLHFFLHQETCGAKKKLESVASRSL